MLALVSFHTNATSKRLHLLEIDLIFALTLAPGWRQHKADEASPGRESWVGQLEDGTVRKIDRQIQTYR
jgi:hypothetical protein